MLRHQLKVLNRQIKRPQLIKSDHILQVFDGQWGYLDQALGTASITAQVTGVADYHIDADEPAVLDYNTDFKTANLINTLYAPDQFRISDHDPVIVGLELDATPPAVDIALSTDTLWSPNHKYVTVTANVDVTDDNDPSPLLEMVSVTSNETDDEKGDGSFINDIVIVNDFTFDLRVERSALGTGRIYTITYRATDMFGNSVRYTATVIVPLDQGK